MNNLGFRVSGFRFQVSDFRVRAQGPTAGWSAKRKAVPEVVKSTPFEDASRITCSSRQLLFSGTFAGKSLPHTMNYDPM